MNQINGVEDSSYWENKPAWCQPWSILLFGLLLLFFSFTYINILILKIIILVLVISWWLLFLIIAPSSYNKYISEKRE